MVAGLEDCPHLFHREGRRRLATGKDVLQSLDQVGHIVVGPGFYPDKSFSTSILLNLPILSMPCQEGSASLAQGNGPRPRKPIPVEQRRQPAEPCCHCRSSATSLLETPI